MKKLILIFVVLVAILAASNLFAYYQRADSALRYTTGGQVVVASNAQIWVYSSGTTSLVTIYSNASGSLMSQPILADRYGNYSYFAAAGSYDESIVGPSGTIAVTRPGIVLGGSTLPYISSSIGTFNNMYAGSAYISNGTGTFNSTSVVSSSVTGSSTNTDLIVIGGPWIDCRGIYSSPGLCDLAGQAAGVGIIFSRTATNITTGMTFSSPVTIRPGALLSISTGQTVTFSRLIIQNPSTQIFSCQTTTCVSFLPGAVKEVYPNLWKTNVTPGTTDMTSGMRSAVSAYSNVHLLSARYLTDTATLRDGTNISGEGIDNTIIDQNNVTASSYGTLFSESSGSTTVVNNIKISNLTIDGHIDTKGFSEFIHLISLNGVNNATITGVKFKGYRGDGLYIGSGVVGGDERHNFNIKVKDCIFDGVTSLNRNGISIIDGNVIDISENLFTNSSSSIEPGPIDIEPDSAFNVIRSIAISNNTFSSNGGMGTISLNSSALVLNAPVHDVSIIGNHLFNNSPVAADLILYTDESPTSVPDMAIVVDKNDVMSNVQPLSLRKLRGAIVSNNTFSGGGAVSLGNSSDASLSLRDIKFVDNKCLEAVFDPGMVTLATVSNVLISGNTFKPKDTVGNTRALIFWGNGVTTVSSDVKILNNNFVKGAYQTTYVDTAGHTYGTPLSNILEGNTVDSSLTTNFQHRGKVAWTPVLSFSSPGDLSTTYSAQSGTAVRVGRMVTASFVVSTATWTFTTSSGALIITGLPYTPTSENNTFGPVFGQGWTLANAVGLTANISPASNRIQIYASRSGSTFAFLGPSQCPSGTQQSYWGSVTYFTDDK